MTERDQLSLELEDRFDWKGIIRRHWPTLLEACRHAADRRGRKQVAADLKISNAVLDNLLADRGRHDLKMKLAVYFIFIDQGFVDAVCRLRGGRFEQGREQTAEEKLAALTAAVRTLGPAAKAVFAIARDTSSPEDSLDG
jgi:hypothetical protein